jgi:hypothetical protein
VHLISQNHTFFLSSSLPITRDTSHSRAPRNKEAKTERIYAYIYMLFLSHSRVRSLSSSSSSESVCFPNLTTISLLSSLFSQQQQQEPRSREREREREREKEKAFAFFPSLLFFLARAAAALGVCCFASVVVVCDEAVEKVHFFSLFLEFRVFASLLFSLGFCSRFFLSFRLLLETKTRLFF